MGREVKQKGVHLADLLIFKQKFADFFLEMSR